MQMVAVGQHAVEVRGLEHQHGEHSHADDHPDARLPSRRLDARGVLVVDEYLAAAGPAFQNFGAKFVVRGGAFETMEGSARERNVVVEFKDRATALACYQSPEYQSARAIRQKYADADFIIIDGIAD